MTAPTYTPLPTVPARTGMTNAEYAAAVDLFLSAFPTLQTEGDALGAFCELQANAALAAAIAGNLSALDLVAAAGHYLKVNAAGTALESIPLPAASVTAAGIVEKASTAEAQSGTAPDKYPDVVGVKSEIVALTTQSAQFRYELPSGTDGGASVVGWNTRLVNTTTYNSLSGAGIASGQIGLLAGTYDIRVLSAGFEAQASQVVLRNVTAGTNDIIGVVCKPSAGEAFVGEATGRVTIASTSYFEVWHWRQAAHTTGLGVASNSGLPEVYVEVNITKIPA